MFRLAVGGKMAGLGEGEGKEKNKGGESLVSEMVVMKRVLLMLLSKN